MTAYADLVRETTSTTGTGTYSLGGAVAGRQTFVAGVGNGAEVTYVCTDGVDWEVGRGTVTDGSPDTLSRTTILDSSNAGSAVNWGVGTRAIYLTLAAADIGGVSSMGSGPILYPVAVSDETTALTTGTGKVTFIIPYAMTLSSVLASVGTAPTGAAIQVDVNRNGTTIFSTPLTIDATEKDSTTAATPAVLSTTGLSVGDEITVDIDQVGSTVAGAGLKVYLVGTATPPSTVREVLTANRTYYVRTDGSDSNDGFANTSGGAFLTIQKAVDTVASLDLGVYAVTIQIGNGTYTGAIELKNLVGSGTVTITGDTGTPNNVLVNVSGAHAITGSNLIGSYHLQGMKVQSSTASGIRAAGKSTRITLSQVNHGACAGAHFFLSGGATVLVSGSAYAIEGNASQHVWADTQSYFEITTTMTVTLTGTPAFTTFVHSRYLSIIFIRSTGVTFSGGATGVRYTAQTLALIESFGGSATYFPGDSAGSTSESGIYT